MSRCINPMNECENREAIVGRDEEVFDASFVSR